MKTNIRIIAVMVITVCFYVTFGCIAIHSFQAWELSSNLEMQSWNAEYATDEVARANARNNAAELYRDLTSLCKRSEVAKLTRVALADTQGKVIVLVVMLGSAVLCIINFALSIASFDALMRYNVRRLRRQRKANAVKRMVNTSQSIR